MCYNTYSGKLRARGVPPSVQTTGALFLFERSDIMVKINGEDKNAAGMTVNELLAEMGLEPARVAVMIDGEIVPKSDYGRTFADGDEADIVGFVGGG